jgi:hypothetical protein
MSEMTQEDWMDELIAQLDEAPATPVSFTLVGEEAVTKLIMTDVILEDGVIQVTLDVA